ncbi:tRNA (guanosine(37)-N1)-methyltransferase TrmD [soil metagenome]
MKITILTLFPAMFKGPFEESILKHAQQKGLVEIQLVNIRDFGLGSHHTVDDTPYGGGHGMVLKVDVLHAAIQHIKQTFLQQFNNETIKQSTILLSASGKTFQQATAKHFAQLDHLILICGHYEGVDARVLSYIDEEISIGDFVLTGGEIPAMLITDAITRLIPGVLKEGVTDNESFSLVDENAAIALEYPQFTKPAVYDGQIVPEVLQSGNHQKIALWRKEQSLAKTKQIRPDLIKASS